MKIPKRSGWYWFLPDENCFTPSGLLRIDCPVILLVGSAKLTRDDPSPELVVRFAVVGPVPVSKLTGDWEYIKEPRRMVLKALKRGTSNL